MLTPTSSPADDEPITDRSMLVLQFGIALAAAGAAFLLAIVR